MFERDLKELALNNMAEECHENSRQHGFWDEEKQPSSVTRALARLAYDVVDLASRIERTRKPDAPLPNLPRVRILDTMPPYKIMLLSKLVLQMTEDAEAIEAVLCSPDDSVGNVGEELIDGIIRDCDTLGALMNIFPDLDPGKTYTEKSTYNRSRPYKHGKLA